MGTKTFTMYLGQTMNGLQKTFTVDLSGVNDKMYTIRNAVIIVDLWL